MRVAVIDLGTNTFNMLISDLNDKSFNNVYSAKTGVRLIKNENCTGIITSDAYNRAIETIKNYKEKIDLYNVNTVRPIATAAFRDAQNAVTLVSEIEKILNVKVEIIDGQKEAFYIYKGIKHAVPLDNKPILIMDIGGGSVELIIANKEKILWSVSYNIGVSRLIEKFKPSDPLNTQDIINITNYITQVLGDFKKILKQYNIDTLIGSSGSFDCFANILSYQIFNKPSDNLIKSSELNIIKFKKMLSTLIISSYDQRTQIRGIDNIRIELIHISSLLVNIVLSYFKCVKVIHSNYAIKEGVLFSMFN